MKFLFICFISFILSQSIWANGTKAPEVIINVFIETEQDLGNKLSFPWNTSIGKLHFKKGAIFKTSDIESQRPFPSPHADTEYGMMLKLTKDAQKRLSHITSLNRGKHIIVFINMKVLDMVHIDKQVDDGIICVWRGLSASDVHMADKLTHRIGETEKQWKARLKEKK